MYLIDTRQHVERCHPSIKSEKNGMGSGLWALFYGLYGLRSMMGRWEWVDRKHSQREFLINIWYCSTRLIYILLMPATFEFLFLSAWRGAGRCSSIDRVDSGLLVLFLNSFFSFFP